MNKYDLEDCVAVVTGGCNGIGAAIVERLCESGARVGVWDMDISSPESRVSSLPSDSVRLFEVDVTDSSSVMTCFSESELFFGSIDLLVNSAGIAGPTSTLWEYPDSDWRRVQSTNVDGTFFCCKAVIPGMISRNYGRIVNIASIAGKEGNPHASAYSASKASVIGLTKSLGKELATYDISVNCVTPATARTRILDQVTDEFIDYMLSKIPRGRFVTVEEISSMVVWLLSSENSFTTGGVFDLSGGRATY